jgi:NADH-quinone oxidoreductase subunit L
MRLMEQLLHIVWLVPILPACAALLIGLFGRDFLGKKVSASLAIASMLANIVIAIGCFLAIRGMDAHDIPYTARLYEWIAAGNLNISMAFAVDQLTCVMLLFISFVGSLVFIYSTGYMHGDKDYTRFFALLSLFASAMFILVLGNSFVTMFIGWEGVGLCSYLLIGFYMDKGWAADAGKKAFIVNRVGDFGFLLGMFILFWTCQSLTFTEVFERAPLAFEAGGVLITAATLLLFLGATGKSAQIPLFIWLPDAMAGPTPVSALIHAATMVTAGVYMVARCSPIFEMAPVTLAVVATIGALTAFVAATIGITQRDIKKVLAYSTVSQLGYMFLGCGVGAYAAGIFHVFTHSFFKGCLFLCAGSVIHGMAGEQDMFKMGGLAKKMKITFWTYLISCFAIAGIPPLSGFFSKDEILWKTWEAGGMFRVLWILGMVAALMTSIYMFRSLWLTFLGKTRADDHAYNHAHESPPSMTVPLIVLAIGAAVVGFLNVPAALSGTPHFEHFLAPALAGGHHAAEAAGHAMADAHSAHAGSSHTLELVFMAVSAGIGVLGLLIAWAIYRGGATARAEKIARAAGPAYQLSANRWWWDDAYNKIIVGGTVAFAYLTLLFDIYIVDGLVNGIGRSVRSSCARLRQLQSGQTQAYALAILIGVNLILACVLFLSR